MTLFRGFAVRAACLAAVTALWTRLSASLGCWLQLAATGWLAGWLARAVASESVVVEVWRRARTGAARGARARRMRGLYELLVHTQL